MIVLNLPYSITVKKVAEVKWNIVGQHNMHNALMAVAAAYHAGVKIEDACHALGSFINAKRRLEVKGEVNGITVYDDFAHHQKQFWRHLLRCVIK